MSEVAAALKLEAVLAHGNSATLLAIAAVVLVAIDAEMMLLIDCVVEMMR